MDSQLIPTVIQGIFAILAMAFARYLIPWLREKAKGEHQVAINKILDTLVEAAEQMYGANAGKDKLDHVLKAAAEQGIQPTDSEIEAAVLRLHTAGKNWADAHWTSERTANATSDTPSSAEPTVGE